MTPPHEEQIPEIGIPAQYFINALKDVDKWELSAVLDEFGSTIRKLTNKGTADAVSWSWNSCNYEYPGKGWMNYSEREAVEKEASKTYQSITTAEKWSKDEAAQKACLSHANDCGKKTKGKVVVVLQIDSPVICLSHKLLLRIVGSLKGCSLNYETLKKEGEVIISGNQCGRVISVRKF